MARICITMLAAGVVLSVINTPGCSGTVTERYYDCQLRALAEDYTGRVVLRGWDPSRAASALALVSHGLKLAECPGSLNDTAAAAALRRAPRPSDQLLPAGVVLHVSPKGSDAGDGTANSPLASIAGAQATIRKRYPHVAARPAITVLIASGDYYYGAAGADHLAKATRYSHTALATFGQADSGSSAKAPITYRAAQGASTAPRFIGGVPLSGLVWSAAAGLPRGVLKTTVSEDVRFDVQDQLFILSSSSGGSHHALIRGRTPNGHPWLPLDGFNLTVQNNFGNLQEPAAFTKCSAKPGHPTRDRSARTCNESVVVCDATNVTQVTGSLGVTTAIGAKLAGPEGVIRVKHCLEHLLNLANDWPNWVAASYGLDTACNMSDPASCVNTLDTTYNFPLWFGPWAAGIEVEASQHPDIAAYTWTGASDVVVHAMADGEWGGTQFRVQAAGKTLGPSNSNPRLNFSMGGFQQARTATLGSNAGSNRREQSSVGNRFYMEGSVEMLDAPGEWHFDAETRLLYVFPPTELGNSSMHDVQLVLTQTDTLFDFTGSASDEGKRVKHVILANLSLAFTSASFFRPHEETSGGDYATHRSGAVKVENATGLKFLSNTFSWIGGNAVFLSNSVRNTTVAANLFQWLGTSGVAVQGKTGVAMMDGRDGEALMTAYGPDADNGVRLPKFNVISGNVFADYGIWDKQSACFHKALAPGNLFLNNVCFNSSRHGVNFQDGFGGGGIAEGNVFFNLNRETKDTTALNSWNRRNYIMSDPNDPARGILVPPTMNEWRRNLILGRNYYGVRDGMGNGLRNDDGASYYTHSHNVLYRTGMQFNGGTQIHTVGNLFIHGGDGPPTTCICWPCTPQCTLASRGPGAAWHAGPTPNVASSFNDTFVDFSQSWAGACVGFWNTTNHPGGKVNHGQPKPGIYTGDFSFAVANSTGRENATDWSKYYCGFSISQWQKHTGGQDMHSTHITNTAGASGEFSSMAMLVKARAMMFG